MGDSYNIDSLIESLQLQDEESIPIEYLVDALTAEVGDNEGQLRLQEALEDLDPDGTGSISVSDFKNFIESMVEADESTSRTTTNNDSDSLSPSSSFKSSVDEDSLYAELDNADASAMDHFGATSFASGATSPRGISPIALGEHSTSQTFSTSPRHSNHSIDSVGMFGNDDDATFDARAEISNLRHRLTVTQARYGELRGALDETNRQNAKLQEDVELRNMTIQRLQMTLQRMTASSVAATTPKAQAPTPRKKFRSVSQPDMRDRAAAAISGEYDWDVVDTLSTVRRMQRSYEKASKKHYQSIDSMRYRQRVEKISDETKVSSISDLCQNVHLQIKEASKRLMSSDSLSLESKSLQQRHLTWLSRVAPLLECFGQQLQDSNSSEKQQRHSAALPPLDVVFDEVGIETPSMDQSSRGLSPSSVSNLVLLLRQRELWWHKIVGIHAAAELRLFGEVQSLTHEISKISESTSTGGKEPNPSTSDSKPMATSTDAANEPTSIHSLHDDLTDGRVDNPVGMTDDHLNNSSNLDDDVIHAPRSKQHDMQEEFVSNHQHILEIRQQQELLAKAAHLPKSVGPDRTTINPVANVVNVPSVIHCPPSNQSSSDAGATRCAPADNNKDRPPALGEAGHNTATEYGRVNSDTDSAVNAVAMNDGDVSASVNTVVDDARATTFETNLRAQNGVIDAPHVQLTTSRSGATDVASADDDAHKQDDLRHVAVSEPRSIPRSQTERLSTDSSSATEGSTTTPNRPSERKSTSKSLGQHALPPRHFHFSQLLSYLIAECKRLKLLWTHTRTRLDRLHRIRGGERHPKCPSKWNPCAARNTKRLGDGCNKAESSRSGGTSATRNLASVAHSQNAQSLWASQCLQLFSRRMLFLQGVCQHLYCRGDVLRFGVDDNLRNRLTAAGSRLGKSNHQNDTTGRPTLDTTTEQVLFSRTVVRVSPKGSLRSGLFGSGVSRMRCIIVLTTHALYEFSSAPYFMPTNERIALRDVVAVVEDPVVSPRALLLCQCVYSSSSDPAVAASVAFKPTNTATASFDSQVVVDNNQKQLSNESQSLDGPSSNNLKSSQPQNRDDILYLFDCDQDQREFSCWLHYRRAHWFAAATTRPSKRSQRCSRPKRVWCGKPKRREWPPIARERKGGGIRPISLGATSPALDHVFVEHCSKSSALSVGRAALTYPATSGHGEFVLRILPSKLTTESSESPQINSNPFLKLLREPSIRHPSKISCWRIAWDSKLSSLDLTPIDVNGGSTQSRRDDSSSNSSNSSSGTTRLLSRVKSWFVGRSNEEDESDEQPGHVISQSHRGSSILNRTNSLPSMMTTAAPLERAAVPRIVERLRSRRVMADAAASVAEAQVSHSVIVDALSESV